MSEYDNGLSLNRSRKSLGDQIYEQLRDDIVYLRLKPGQMIYENEIADRLEVSRTPVREAFRLLANEQLIEIQPQRGTKITPISIRKVSEARFVREHLEIGAFRHVSRTWNADASRRHEPELTELLKRQQAAVETDDAETLLKLDEDFHKRIIGITENQTLLQVINHMRAHINRIRFLALQESPHMERIVVEHREMMDGIRTGDEERTSVLLDDHFRKLDEELPELRALYPDFFVN